MTGAANVIHKRRAQNSGDPVLGDDAAEFVGRNTQQREVEQTRFFRKAVSLDRNSGQRRNTAQIKREHDGVLGEQLLLALLFFCCLLAVPLDRKIGVAVTIPNS